MIYFCMYFFQTVFGIVNGSVSLFLKHYIQNKSSLFTLSWLGLLNLPQSQLPTLHGIDSHPQRVIEALPSPYSEGLDGV